jgi:FMN-dependent NADH-azoreductase
MAKLLYIEASPRKERSASIKVAGEFMEAYRQAHPNDQVEMLDLWKKELPPFDGDVINAKYRILHGGEGGMARGGRHNRPLQGVR